MAPTLFTLAPKREQFDPPISMWAFMMRDCTRQCSAYVAEERNRRAALLAKNKNDPNGVPWISRQRVWTPRDGYGMKSI